MFFPIMKRTEVLPDVRFGKASHPTGTN